MSEDMKQSTTEQQQIDKSVYIAPGVQFYGNITIGAESSVWPNVVMRAEAHEIRIGRYTNIQDFTMVHVGQGTSTEIGDFCSITHHATVHGCRIEDECLIGINAVVMDGAEIGRGSIVAGGAMIREEARFPAGSIIAGVPAKQIGERDSSQANRINAWHYQRNARAYQRNEHRAWTGPDYATWLADLVEKVKTNADREVLKDAT